MLHVHRLYQYYVPSYLQKYVLIMIEQEKQQDAVKTESLKLCVMARISIASWVPTTRRNDKLPYFKGEAVLTNQKKNAKTHKTKPQTSTAQHKWLHKTTTLQVLNGYHTGESKHRTFPSTQNILSDSTIIEEI